jgi:YtcA family
MRKGRETMPPKYNGSRRTRRLQMPRSHDIQRAAAAGVLFAPQLMAAGCSRAPTFNILGSFFPAWILCGIVGILLAVVVRLFFVRIKLEDQLLAPLILVYPCLTAFFTFSLWLVFFS